MESRCQCGAQVDPSSVDSATQTARCASCGAPVTATAASSESASGAATATDAPRKAVAIPRGFRFAGLAVPERGQTYRETAIASGKRWVCRPWRAVHMLPLIFAGVAAAAPAVLQPSRASFALAAVGGLVLLLVYLWTRQRSTIELGAGGLRVLERGALSPYSWHVTMALSEIDSFYATHQGSSPLCLVGVLDRELNSTVVVDSLTRHEAQYLAGALNEALHDEMG